MESIAKRSVKLNVTFMHKTNTFVLISDALGGISIHLQVNGRSTKINIKLNRFQNFHQDEL